MHTAKHKSDYYFLYQTKGFTRLIVDFCVMYYGPFDTVVICDEGVLRYYVSNKDKSPKTVEEIAARYSSVEKFKKLCADLPKELTQYGEHIDILEKACANQTLTGEHIREFALVIAKTFEDYALFDHVNTDNLFLSKTIDYAADIIDLIERHKNKIREAFDLEFFDPAGSMERFYTVLSKKLDCNNEQITSCTLDELCDLVDGPKNTNTPVFRNTFVGLREGERVSSMVEEEARDFISAFEGEEATNKSADEMQGRSVSSEAVVRGTAQVIKVDYNNLQESLQEANKMAEGYVLIAEATLQELLPAMQKSVAIVTDMGGMLSHAAITARELGKPCLVGCEGVSAWLKSGDMVEVDTKKQIIKKLT